MLLNNTMKIILKHSYDCIFSIVSHHYNIVMLGYIVYMFNTAFEKILIPNLQKCLIKNSENLEKKIFL